MSPTMGFLDPQGTWKIPTLGHFGSPRIMKYYVHIIGPTSGVIGTQTRVCGSKIKWRVPCLPCCIAKSLAALAELKQLNVAAGHVWDRIVWGFMAVRIFPGGT